MLGIAGEAGASELLSVMQWLAQREQKGQSMHDLPKLKELYMRVLRQMHGDQDENSLQKEMRAMEQRIQHMVFQAFTHLSSLDLIDYTNPTFEHFRPTLVRFRGNPPVHAGTKGWREDNKMPNKREKIFARILYRSKRIIRY